jgi:uncharacterized protein YeaO (DUF488 family)
MNVVVKRVYRKLARNDGTRVLVDRLWPRGLTKHEAAVDAWLRNLAPSNELRKWYHSQSEQWEEFRRRYLKELEHPAARTALERLYKLAGTGKITLLFASKNEDRNNAVVLRDLLGGARKPPTGTGPAAAGAFRERRAARAPRR